MRRASHHGTVTRRPTPPAPPAVSVGGSFEPAIELADESSRVDEFLSSNGPFANGGETATNAGADRSRRLASAIMQRIESRLPGRVRNLAVRINADTIVLEGQCATYYTKQLAQHAALGILEDEHLENAIVVTVGR